MRPLRERVPCTQQRRTQLRQTYHVVNNGPTKPNHFESMMQANDNRLQLSFGTPPIQRPIMEKIKGRIHFVSGQIGGQNQV